MATKHDMKKTQKTPEMQNKPETLEDLKIPTPEELGFSEPDTNLQPIIAPPPIPNEGQKEKKGLFKLFSKKEDKTVEVPSIPEAPKLDGFSFPEFDKNPIQPIPTIPQPKSLETEYLSDKIQKPIEMPSVGDNLPTKEKKSDAQSLIDEHALSKEDEDNFDDIQSKLDEIESALKKHLEEIESKMDIVRSIEKEINALDVKIDVKQSKKPSKSAKKSKTKATAKKGKKK